MKVVGFLPSVIACAALSVPAVLAQTQDEVRHAPDGGTRTMIESIFIPPVANAPFTATVVTEVTRHLDDGSTITNRNHRIVARDSAGRIFQERRAFTPNGDQQETALVQLDFSDPTSHTLYVCTPNRQICELRGYFASAKMVASSAAAPAGASGSKTRSLSSEDLGHDTIEGLDTIGSRDTTTIAAGAIGNDKSLSVVKEFWYSPQLGLNIVVNRVDPRSGTETFRVTAVNLGEPDPKLFDPPAGFRVVDTRKSAEQ
jgi:hypothetical protein